MLPPLNCGIHHARALQMAVSATWSFSTKGLGTRARCASQGTDNKEKIEQRPRSAASMGQTPDSQLIGAFHGCGCSNCAFHTSPK